jgi:predicted XRE-type DNA-binding protein
VESRSDEVFADLGFADAAERTTKVALAVELNRILKAKGLTQAAAAKLLDVNQPKISALLNYRLDGFSVERLLNFLTALGRDVRITIKSAPAGRNSGRISIATG